MKKTLFIALLGMMLLALTSCNKEEDLIIGTWITTGQSYYHQTWEGSTLNPNYFEDGEYTYEFKRNGKYTSTFSSFLDHGYEPEEYSYSIENGKITLEGEGTFEIQELTKKKLVFHKEKTDSGFTDIWHYEFVKK